jgi:hypothetical protein
MFHDGIFRSFKTIPTSSPLLSSPLSTNPIFVPYYYYLFLIVNPTSSPYFN